MEVLEVPEPPAPGPGEVIVHPDAVGICGSDFHFFAGELQIFEGSPYPRIQGHEFTGTIEQLGPETSGRLGGRRPRLHPPDQQLRRVLPMHASAGATSATTSA